MKTLIKMIMLGVLMTSGVAFGEGDNNLDFSSDTESHYNGDVDNDISSNEYVAAQYNCSGEASCGTAASSNGGGGVAVASSGTQKVQQIVISTPPVAATQINATNADMCRTGISAGASTLGIGITAGITLVDKNCEMIKMVRLLNNLGLKDVALALLGQDSRVAQAMLQANPEYYARFIADETRNLENESNAAETAANGKEIEHDVIDEETPSAEGFNIVDLFTKKD